MSLTCLAWGDETDRQPPPESEKPAVPAPVVPTKKPQSTFGAFSSSASPFASTSSASPFASTSKPLSTGSAFGNYSSTSSPFARKPPAFASTDATAAPVDKEEKKETESTTEKPEVKSGNSFGDILKESKADEGDDNAKVQMTEKDGMSSFFLITISVLLTSNIPSFILNDLL